VETATRTTPRKTTAATTRKKTTTPPTTATTTTVAPTTVPGPSECQIRRNAVVQASENDLKFALSRVDVHVMKCTEFGQFDEIQCWPWFGTCWCVDQDGNEVAGTKTNSSRPKCPKPISKCKNVRKDALCNKFASYNGYCQRNRAYMKALCAKSCNFCDYEPKRPGCSSEFGCCPDGITPASDRDYMGCPEYDSVCDMKLVPGPCRAYLEKYFYNATSGNCEKFVYGGCKGNQNNFNSLLSCRIRCMKGKHQTAAKETTFEVTKQTQVTTESVATRAPSTEIEPTSSPKPVSSEAKSTLHSTASTIEKLEPSTAKLHSSAKPTMAAGLGSVATAEKLELRTTQPSTLFETTVLPLLITEPIEEEVVTSPEIKTPTKPVVPGRLGSRTTSEPEKEATETTLPPVITDGIDLTTAAAEYTLIVITGFPTTKKVTRQPKAKEHGISTTEVPTTAEVRTQVTFEPDLHTTLDTKRYTTAAPGVQTTIKPDVQTTVEPDEHTTAKVEVQATVEPEVYTTAKPEVYTTAETDVQKRTKSETQTTVEPELYTTVEPKVSTTVEPKAYTTIETDVQKSTQSETQTTVEPELYTTVEPKVSTTVEPKAYTTVETDVQKRTKSEIQTTVEPELFTTIEPKAYTTVEIDLQKKN